MKQAKSTRRYGLIGYPVKHSFSKAMHEAAFKACKIDATYELFEVKPEELEDFLLNRKDWDCINVTIPHKVKAKEILERSYPYDKNIDNIQPNLLDAILTGAINTVKRNENRLDYWNTDAEGFIKSLEQDLGFELNNVQEPYKNVLLFGCGGAGRAVIAGLSWQQHRVDKIYVFDKSEKAIDSAKEYFKTIPGELPDRLAEKIEFLTESQIADKIKECQLLVNASPIGMKKDDGSVIDKKLLHEDLFIYDVVYNRETQLVKDAKELNLKAVGGLGMLLYQGDVAFNLWTGKAAPVEIMRKVLEQELKKCQK